MLEVRPTSDHQRWNSWLHQRDLPPFTQSAEWADILSNEGKTVELLEFRSNTAKLAQALVVFQSLPFGWQYAFCPRGPVVADQADEPEVYAALVEYCRRQQCLFVRVEPTHLPILSAAKKVIDINPRATVLLDLRQPLEKLINQMHQKTRYNIRLAEKKQLTLTDTKNPEVLLDLMVMTGKRDGFSLHDRQHYEEILQSPLSTQLTVWLDKKPIATMVLVGCGNTYTYLYGASDYQHRAMMAPYLLQWAAIKQGQEKGYRWYDFFGIAPLSHPEQGARPARLRRSRGGREGSKDSSVASGDTQNDIPQYDQRHQYAGVTRFKLGFGGVVTEAPGTYDLLIFPLQYKMYELLRRVRRWF